VRGIVDLTGLQFGRLTVTAFAYRGRHHKKPMWRCVCTCGRKKVVLGQDLKRGATQSCGCFRGETSGGRTRTHGMSAGPLYGTWRGMLMRCGNPRAINYPDYGALGVKVCARWHVFRYFHADVGDPPPGKTLDRRNPFGDYEPNNWRWATRAEQRLNTRGHFAMRMIDLLDPAVRQALCDRIMEEPHE